MTAALSTPAPLLLEGPVLGLLAVVWTVGVFVAGMGWQVRRDNRRRAKVRRAAEDAAAPTVAERVPEQRVGEQ